MVREARAYRVGKYRALAVQLENPGAAPWSAAGAQLLGSAPKALPLLPLVQVAPTLPGARGWVVVELAEAEELPPGPFTLTLWEEGGERVVTLENLTFP